MIEHELKSFHNLLTVGEVAEVLRLGRNSVYELISDKDLPVVRVGSRRIMIPKDEFIQWIKKDRELHEIEY
ncbi:helix-turn-helix domain-containing protein [Clostridium tyrobutyricum]|jgi:excisionase family DNA binding protein|uniref:helix-turn-helix domain-containing protein n=1 Tax=Clostridium tyrobutyricum TaxID=1519 RepID=UPI0010AA5BBD|nr:helix-turn-helix domain-containing protein [Clostridium tyrobutyricum]MBR9648181.1 helix-turn-helix domain-containing protein [Clostridium tyrobutyricum]QCH29473.1 Helix-turn-helix domain protein [Clostridium tyrobutyricum]